MRQRFRLPRENGRLARLDSEFSLQEMPHTGGTPVPVRCEAAYSSEVEDLGHWPPLGW